jgi:type II secretion system protein L
MKILAVDISTSAVRAALMMSSLKGAWLETSAQVPLASDADVEDAVGDCIERLSDRADLSGAVCLAAVPAGQVFFRNISLPFKDERKVRQVLSFEVEPDLPVPVEELVFDFFSAPNQREQVSHQVVAAALEKTRMEAVLRAFANCKLDPETVTVGGYAEAAGLLKTQGVPDCWLYAKLDRNGATVCIAASGRLLLVRHIEADLGREKGMEKLCRRIDQSRLLAEILYQVDIRPKVVYWTGNGIDQALWEAQIAERFQCGAETVDFLQLPGVKWLPPSGQPQGNATVAAGTAPALALIGLTGAKVLNFRRGPFALKKLWLEYKSSLIRTAALVLLVLFLGLFQLYTEIHSLDREVRQLQQETRAVFTAAFPDVARIVDPVQQMRVEIQEMRRQPALVGLLESGKLKIELLKELSSRIPKDLDVEITRLVIVPDSMSISGSTSSFNTVNEVKSRLEKGGMFTEVTISSANLDKSGDRVNFKLWAGL